MGGGPAESKTFTLPFGPGLGLRVWWGFKVWSSGGAHRVRSAYGLIGLVGFRVLFKKV